MYLIPKNFPGQLPSELVPVVANIALVSLSLCKCVFLSRMIEGELGPLDKTVTPVNLCTYCLLYTSPSPRD